MADTSPTPAAPTEDSSNGGSTTTKTAEDVSSPIFLSKDTEIQSKILGDEHDDDEILEVEPEPSSTICNIEEILVGQNENNDDNVFQPTPTSPESINTVIQSPLDPLAESYRSVIELINRTSQGFKEGQKWKCNHTCGTRTRKKLRDRWSGGSYLYNYTNNKSSTLAAEQAPCLQCNRRCSQCDISFEEDDSCININMLTHSKTLDYGTSSSEDRRRNWRNRQLLRQMATYESNEEAENINEDGSGGNKRVSRRSKARDNMIRQWTTDPLNLGGDFDIDQEESMQMLQKSNKATSSPMVMSNNSNTFLLRPTTMPSTARNSKQPTEELTSPAAKAAIAAAIAAAGLGGGHHGAAAGGGGNGRSKLPLAPPNTVTSGLGEQLSLLSGAEVHSAPNGGTSVVNMSSSASNHHNRIRRQRTTESAPTGHFLSGGVAIRHLPRQQSDASAYSMAIPSTSFSHQNITLVRGASCSLVDIPTYLGPALHTSTGLVETSCTSAGTGAVPRGMNIDATAPGSAGPQMSGVITTNGGRGSSGDFGTTNNNATGVQGLAGPRSTNTRLQLDLTSKRNSSTTGAKATQSQKTKWTIICVGLTLLTMCVALVGTMLSIGSQYTKQISHRKWEEFSSTPNVVDKINKEDIDSKIGSTVKLSKINQQQSSTSTTMSPIKSRMMEKRSTITQDDDSPGLFVIFDHHEDNNKHNIISTNSDNIHRQKRTTSKTGLSSSKIRKKLPGQFRKMARVTF